jgi:bacterioferritin
MLAHDLDYELEVANGLNQGIELCEQSLDHGTRQVLIQLLTDTEGDHIFWLESQLHLIATLGLPTYLSQQL